jgi:hypothetical protein
LSADRTIAIDSTVATLTGTQTLTNKTINLASNTLQATSAEIAAAVTDETGTGALVFANSPTLVTPALGTPSALVGTNITGTAAGLTAGNVTTNANLTGAIISTGNATLLGSFSSANLAGALTDETGTGSAVFANSPTLVTPALGTPASGVVTNLTGTASININGTVGATTATTGAFTTLSTSSDVTLSGGTANGVAYLNGSKVLTTGSALTFDGTNLGAPAEVYRTSATSYLRLSGGDGAGSGANVLAFGQSHASAPGRLVLSAVGTGDLINATINGAHLWQINSAEQMRLTSTGLGIGTSSPVEKLSVNGGIVSTFGANLTSGAGSYLYYTSATTSAELTALNPGVAWLNQKYSALTHAWNISGTESMTLTSTGLGIGTSSPAEKLTVAGRINFSSYSTDADIFGFYAVSGVGTVISAAQTNSITFRTNASEKMRLDSSGNLGIGTSSPGSILDIVGSGNPTLTLRGSAGAYTSFLKLQAAAGGASVIDANGGQNTLYLQTNGTTKATLDSSGNLGLGVTPQAKFNVQYADSAPTSSGTIASGVVLQYATGGVALNMGTSSGGYSYFNSAFANNAGVGSAYRFYQGATQAMTLDASGNLLVGKTSGYRSGKLVVAAANVSQTSTLANIHVTTTDSQGADLGGSIGMGGQVGGDETPFGLISGRKENGTSGNYAGYLAFATQASSAAIAERARIDSSGNLLVGATSGSDKIVVVQSAVASASQFKNASGTDTAQCVVAWHANTTGDNVFHQFFTETSATSRGSITYNRAGGLVAYNTTSDYRAKDILGPVVGSGALIDSVPVYMGKMKDATQERPMFIAHEVPAYAHTGEKDAVDADGNPVYQQMDASALIPVMWAEIQSLRARLAAANI